MENDCYAEGGEAQRDDSDEIMDHVAMEAIHAVHNKDKGSFRDAFHALIADVLNKMNSEEDK